MKIVLFGATAPDYNSNREKSESVFAPNDISERKIKFAL